MFSKGDKVSYVGNRKHLLEKIDGLVGEVTSQIRSRMSSDGYAYAVRYEGYDGRFILFERNMKLVEPVVEEIPIEEDDMYV